MVALFITVVNHVVVISVKSILHRANYKQMAGSFGRCLYLMIDPSCGFDNKK